MMPSGVGGVAISVPFAHRYCCPMPIGSTLSVLAARVCVPSLRVRQLLLVWSSDLCVSQVGGRGRVACKPLILIEAPSPATPHGMLIRGQTYLPRRRRPQCDFPPLSTHFTAVLTCTPVPWTSASSHRAVTSWCTVT